MEVDAQLLLSAKDELKQQAQLREDLQQVSYTSCCCGYCLATLVVQEVGRSAAAAAMYYRVGTDSGGKARNVLMAGQ